MKEEKEDFFDEIPEDKPVRPKEPKKPPLKPDDPLYYEQEEGEWEHLVPSPYRRSRIIGAIIGVFVIVGVFFLTYLYFFTPQIDEAEETGYVEDIHREGMLVETYEGTLLPYKAIKDTLRPYENDFRFSTKNVDVATELRRRQHSGQPVRVKYEVYRHTLPWRGKYKVIVTGIDSVNPKTLLPPERQPNHL